MIEKKIEVGPFACNARLIICDQTFKAIWIDPGDEAKKLIQLHEKTEQELGQKIEIVGLMHTHAHFDHIGATRDLKNHYGSVEVAIHNEDFELYKALRAQGQWFGYEFKDPCSITRFLIHEEEFFVGKLKFKCIHTPGHSPGSLCFYMETTEKPYLFSGDTLFYRSIGRTDLWRGSMDDLKKSFKERIFSIDQDTCVCPGHGVNTRLGDEQRLNPYLVDL